MHYLCGKITEPTQWHVWKGGFLIFDSDLLPSDHELECSLTLQVDAYPSYYSSGVVFSFSEWEMDFADCDRNNLTIVDGDLDKNKFSGKDIQGKHHENKSV